ncbi:hypothetical protein Q4I32_002242 [Leishmania shawi]|uniref:DUF4200 domain-containing protein n=1 Tax=Leishmania shawi TaxID=5680 RepID=A0AAW3C509_9TRYP
MSSLIQCTDDLLRQKAVQSSHYERLERQLLDGERCRRTAILALRQRAADVTRRGKDVADLRRENHQLADQLAQHALQLAALQCRSTEAKKRGLAAVERLEDGIRSFSGHPARVVLLVQALQAQTQLHCAGRRFSKALRLLWATLRVRRQAFVFVAQSTRVLSSHAALHARLASVLRDRVTRCLEMRDAACSRSQAATAAREGRVMAEQQTAERKLLAVKAHSDFLSVYTEALDDMCRAAKEDVAALSATIDSYDAPLSAMHETLQEKAAAVSEAKQSLTAQQTAHAEALKLHEMHLARTTEELSNLVTAEGLANTHAAELQRSVHSEEKHTQPLARRVYALAFLILLCERDQLRLSQQRTAQAEERTKVELELTQLRTRHEERLERLRATRAAAADAAARDALLLREAQGRKAAVDLEEDEWRLLYAQLFHDVCRARADASAAVAAAKSARRPSAAGGREEGEEGRSARRSQRKRARAVRQSHVTKTTASRRQRAALEAVDASTLTSSQHSNPGYRTTTHVDEEVAAAELTAQEQRSGAARVMTNNHATPQLQLTASSTLRPSYRLTSVKPATVAKKPTRAAPVAAASRASLSGKKRKANGGAVAGAGGVQHTPAAAAARVSAMSPYTSAVSDESSDSSFSLVNSRKKVAAETDSWSDMSDIRLSSPSPSPRCPHGRRAGAVPPIAAAKPLPRPVLRHGCGEAAVTTAQHISGSALASALAACTPRGPAIGRDDGQTSAHSSSFLPHFTGNFVALPSVGSGTRLPHTSLPPRPTMSKAVPPPRRRVPFLAASFTDAGEDLFADMFS